MLGSAIIEVRPDLDKFEKLLNKELKKVAAKAENNVEVGIKADAKRFEQTLIRDLRKVIDKAERGRGLEVEVSPDTTGFATDLRRELATALDRAAGDAKLDIDTSVKAQVEVDSRAVQDTLNKVTDTSDITINFDAKALQASFTGLQAVITQLNASLASFAATAAGTLAPATKESTGQLQKLQEIATKLSTPIKSTIQVFSNLAEGVRSTQALTEKFQGLNDISVKVGNFFKTGFNKTLEEGGKQTDGFGDKIAAFFSPVQKVDAELKTVNSTIDGSVQRILKLKKGLEETTITFDAFGVELSRVSKTAVNFDDAIDPRTLGTVGNAFDEASKRAKKADQEFSNAVKGIQAQLSGIPPVANAAAAAEKNLAAATTQETQAVAQSVPIHQRAAEAIKQGATAVQQEAAILKSAITARLSAKDAAILADAAQRQGLTTTKAVIAADAQLVQSAKAVTTAKTQQDNASQKLASGGIVRVRQLADIEKAAAIQEKANIAEIGRQRVEASKGTGSLSEGFAKAKAAADNFKAGLDASRASTGAFVAQAREVGTGFATVFAGVARGRQSLTDFSAQFKASVSNISNAQGVIGKLKQGFTEFGAITGKTIPSLTGLAGGAAGAQGALSQLGAAAGPAGIAVAAVGAAAVIAGKSLFDAGQKIISMAQAAANLNEAQNAIAVQLGATTGISTQLTTEIASGVDVLEKYAGTADIAAAKFLKLADTAHEFGVSQAQLNQAVTPIAAILKGAGFAGENLTDGIGSLADRAIDLASVFNTDVNTVLGKFGAALRGETDPVESLGISFKALDVDLKAAALGFKEVNGQFPESAKQAARLQLILEKSEANAGDFANTLATSLPNQQRVFTATIAKIREEISAQFLPAALRVQTAMLNFAKVIGPAIVGFFKAVKPGIDAVATAFSFFADAIKLAATSVLIPLFNQLVDTFKAFAPAVKPVLILLATAFRPALLLIGAAIAAVVVFLKALQVQLFVIETVVKAVTLVIGKIVDVFKAALGPVIAFVANNIKTLLIPVIVALGPLILTVVGAVKLAQLAFNALKAVIDFVAPAFRAAAEGAKIIAEAIGNRIKQGVDLAVAAFNILRGIISAVIERIQGFISAITGFGPIGAIVGALTAVFQRVGDAIDSVFNKIKSLTKLPIINRFFKGSGDAAKEAGDKLQFFNGKVDITQLKTKAIGNTAEATAESLKKLGEGFNNALTGANGLISAQEGLNSARASEAQAGQRVGEIEAQLTDLRKQRAAISSDTARFAAVEADALEKIRSIEKSIRDLQKEREDITRQEQRRIEDFEPTRQKFEDDLVLANLDLAQAKRDAEAAQLALNDAVKQGVEEETPSVNLAGLSLDQIRSKLANVRATLAAQKQAKKVDEDGADTGKTKAELEEDALRASINVREQEQNITDLQRGRADFIRESSLAQQEFNDKVIELGLQETKLNSEKVAAQTEFNRLAADEFGKKTEIRAITEQIRSLEQQRAAAGAAAAAAAKASAVASATVALELAKASGRQDAILAAEIALLQAKKGTLGSTKETNAALDQQILKLQQIQRLQGLAATQGPTFDINKQVLEDALKARAQRGLTSEESADSSKVLKGLINDALADAGTLLSGAGSGRQLSAIANALKNPDLISKVIEGLLADPTADLRQLFQRIFRELGLTVPGFAKGGIVEGASGAMGTLVRAGEFGRREAILPLTRPARMESLMGDSRILGPVLDALPRISLAGASVPRTVAPVIPQRSAASRSGSQPYITAKEKERERRLLAEAIADAMVAKGFNAPQIEVSAPVTIQTPGVDSLTERAIARRIKKEIEDRW